jgi:hypothetical protein
VKVSGFAPIQEFLLSLLATALGLVGVVGCAERPLTADIVVNGSSGGSPGSDPAAGGGSGGAAGAPASSRGDPTVGGGSSRGSVPVSDGGSPLCAVLAEGASGAPSDPTPVPTGCYCTRRPGPANSYKCPAGAGQSVEMTIGPDGGTISLQGQQGASSGAPFEIEFPPGALAAPTVVRVTETTVPPPKDFIDFSPVYRVDPQGTTLAAAAKLQIPWGNLDGGGPRLSSYALTDPTTDGGCTFTPIADSYMNAGFEQSSLVRFGYFFVGAPKTDATATCP